MSYQNLQRKTVAGSTVGQDQAAQQIASNIAPKIQTQQNQQQNIGPVGQINSSPGLSLGPVMPITLIADNSGGSEAATYKIGDPGNICSGKLGLTITDWASTSTWQNASLQEFARMGYVITQINYRVSSNTSQFAQTFNYAVFNPGSSYQVTPLNTSITATERNTQQSQLLQTINWPEGLTFITGTIAYLNVLAGQTVTLTCSYAAILQ